MNQEILLQIGLSENEAALYADLLHCGESSVGDLTDRVEMKRSNIYNILESLITRGAVIKTERRGVAYFQVTDPENLRILAEQKEMQMRQYREAIESALPSLKSLYQLTQTKPLIHSFEGLLGMQKMYDDVIHTKKDILLIRSIYDNDSSELQQVVKNQVKKQVKLGIHTRLLAPVVSSTKDRFLTKDALNLVERRMVPLKYLSLPAQIIVYGDKVAITSLKDRDVMVSTIIENKHISETIRVLFEYMWMKGLSEHEQFEKKVLGA